MKRAPIAATVGALALVLASCSGSDESGAPEAAGEDNGAGDNYIVLSGAAPFTENYNPFAPTNTPGTQVLFETLFFVNSHRDAEADYQPVLGVDYEFSEDNSVLTVETREGVTWNDGEPFTAEDVAFTFNYVREHAAINAQGLTGEAEVTGENEVTITYPEGVAVDAMNSLARQVIIPQHIWEDVDDPATFTNEEGVGTGAFTTGEFDTQTFTYEANPDYWEEGKPQIAGVRYIASSDNEAAADRLLDGVTSWGATGVPNAEEFFSANPDLEVFGTITGLLSLATCSNEELGCEGPQTDPAVRQAIYHAMDREQINTLAFTGDSMPISPTYVYVPRDEVWVSPDIDEPMAPMSADQELAQEILEEAGWQQGSDGIYERDGERLSLEVKSVSGWSDWNMAVDTMAEQLQPVGIELRPNLISSNAWSADVNQGTFQLLVWNVESGTPSEPYGIYRQHFATSATAPVGESIPGSGHTRYSNDTVDAALSVLSNTLDEDEMAEQYGIIQQEIMEDLPYIPILSYQNFSQYNTAHAGNWPTPDNAYAGAMSWMNPDFGVVLKNLTAPE